MDLRCTICNKDYDEFQRLPRVIPQCGHSYCQKCIKKKLQERKNIFVCPIDNQSHIFRRQNDELPRNFAIINGLRQKKSQSLAKSRQNMIMKKYNEDIKNSSLVCQQHQKPKQFMCLDDQETICSHCAIFGSHQGHKLEKISKPKSNKGLEDLFDKAMLGMESLSAQAIHVTQSPNIFVQSFQNLKRTLRTSIKEAFKSYHQIITRRQAYVQKQLDELIRNWQTQAQKLQQKVSSSYKSIIDIKDHLNLLNPDKEESSRDPQVLVMELEDLIEKMKQTEKDISKTKQQISIKCRQYQSQYKQRLQNSKFFKIQEIAVDMSGASTHGDVRSKSKDEHDTSYNLKVRPPSHSINQSREQNLRKDTNLLPPKHHTATNLIKLGSTAKSRLITANSHHDAGDSLSKSNHKEDHSMDFYPSRKCSPSPIQKQKQEKRTSGRAQVRKKIVNILEVISKAETSTLQLLGLEIKDYYLQEIFDYIIKSGKKFGVIKFVKNDITDQGLQVILESVKNYEYLHTLNLTSNQLTQHSLDLIINFSNKNKILKNFYLRNNLINIQKTKDKKKLMFEQGLNIFY